MEEGKRSITEVESKATAIHAIEQGKGFVMFIDTGDGVQTINHLRGERSTDDNNSAHGFDLLTEEERDEFATRAMHVLKSMYGYLASFPLSSVLATLKDLRERKEKREGRE